MLRRISFISLLVLLFSLELNATHIVGGEIYYDCLGNNDYKVTLKVYRDCINGIPPFDDPASIGVFDGVTGALVQNLMVYSPSIIPITSTISVPCYAPAPGTVCEEEATYTTTINLPPNPNGYLLVYQRCCRNNTIVNLVNPGNQGSTVSTYVPPPSLAVCNSSARFNYYPPIYLCQGLPFIFDHSASDPDGDSLAYHLCAPNDGASSVNPMPQPPNGPPYLPVTYQSPYNASNQMASSPAMVINVNSGIITGTPTLMGTWVVAVCCEEWRNGQLINTSMRDFQFNVVMCQPIPVTGQISANINTSNLNCTGLVIPFSQSSVNASNFYWNFGDPTTTNDTSNLPSSVYAYPSNGTYTVTLIANPGSSCADTDQVVITVTVPPTIQFAPPPPQCVTGNSFNLQATGTYGAGATFSWNLGSHATPSTSTALDPQNVVFDTSGVFPVTVTVTDNGCSASYTDYITVYPEPDAQFDLTPINGCVPLVVHFTDHSTSATPMLYTWYFGDGDSSHLANPVHTYMSTGSYDVMLVIQTTSGCISLDTLFAPGLVNVYPYPTAGFSLSDTVFSQFSPYITATDLSTGADSCRLDFGDGYVTTDCNAGHSYWTYGNYIVMQVVYNDYGCTDTAWIPVEVLPEFRFYIPNTFTPNGDGRNDIFMPAVSGCEQYHFMIFDRWGMLIFETDNTEVGWDGRFRGSKCQEDVYVWKVDFLNGETQNTETHIGHVNLIR
jgi:gliding motility-associated-like protein